MIFRSVNFALLSRGLSRMAMYGESPPTSPVRKFSIDIGGMRQPYKKAGEMFSENDLVSKEPFEQFESWFQEACQMPEIKEPNAMCLATATRDGVPSARMVLLKGYGCDGFRFYTNHTSRKGNELEENPRAALVIYWESLSKQVRVEGPVVRLTEEESETYFHSRPRQSQLSAVMSPQSQVIPGRQYLKTKAEELDKEHEDPSKTIPKPQYWGGYKVVPEAIEFWQGQTSRRHDRIRFRKKKDDEEVDGVLVHEGEDGWVFERLAP